MDITSLSLFLLGFAVLPPSFSMLVLLLRSLSSSIISIYRLPARGHFMWLPESPFLPDQPGCEAAPATPDLAVLLFMEEFSVVSYKPAAGEQVECAFCLCAIEAGQDVRELRCAHLFHRGCLDRWLCHRRRTCPLCRKFLLP